MSIKILTSTETNGLGINTDHEALVAPTQDVAKAGQVLIGTENNAEGDGIGRKVRPCETSPDFRLRTAVDTTLFSDNYSHGVANTSKYRVVNTTATNALSGGRWVLNNGNSVTSGQGTQFSTYAKFSLSLSSVVYCDFVAQFAQVLQTNNVVEFGLGYVSGVTAPTDGAFFRMSSSGVALGVISIGGSETTVALQASDGVAWVPAPANSYHFLVVAHNDITEFWIDDVCVGEIVTPPAFGSPTLSMSNPLFARIYNSGTVTTAQRFELSNVSVTAGDVNNNRLWHTTMACMGNSGVNVPDGTTAGHTANYANTVAPVSATLANATAGYATLGGQWQFVAVAGAETDYALFAYLNPVGSATVPAKNLIVRGVRIDTFNSVVAVATTPTVFQWGLGVGSTNVSLATADSATTGARAPRRITLGVQAFPVASAVGALATPIDINMDAPVVVEPGCYLHVILKMPIGTATATEVFRGTCFINSYFE